MHSRVSDRADCHAASPRAFGIGLRERRGELVSKRQEAGSDAALCEATAVCLATRLKEEKVWDTLMANGLDAIGTGRYYARANECFARAEAGD